MRHGRRQMTDQSSYVHDIEFVVVDQSLDIATLEPMLASAAELGALYSLDYTYVMEPGEAIWPRPPIALIIGRGTRLLICISARDNHHIAQSREDKMSKPIFILNGPNLNLLGQREPEIYGRVTLEEVREKCEARAKSLGREIDFRQTNFEGTLIESVHEARQKACGIIINPAGWTFTSIALLDSLKMFEGPKIELHITNVHKRESIYHKSLISLTATGLILGLGTYGYEVAVDAINQMIGAG